MQGHGTGTGERGRRGLGVISEAKPRDTKPHYALGRLNSVVIHVYTIIYSVVLECIWQGRTVQVNLKCKLYWHESAGAKCRKQPTSDVTRHASPFVPN